MVDQKTEAAAEAKKRKKTESQTQYLQAKKNLKLLEEEAESFLKSSDKKAKESLKKHNFGLLTQSVAMKDKATELQKAIDAQNKIVNDLKSTLVQ